MSSIAVDEIDETASSSASATKRRRAGWGEAEANSLVEATGINDLSVKFSPEVCDTFVLHTQTNTD